MSIQFFLSGVFLTLVPGGALSGEKEQADVFVSGRQPYAL